MLITTQGKMAERSNALVLKTSVPRGTRGSNPFLSAMTDETSRQNVELKFRNMIKFVKVLKKVVKKAARAYSDGFNEFYGPMIRAGVPLYM